MKNNQRIAFAPVSRRARRLQRGWTMIEILVSIAVVAGFLYWVAGRGNLLGRSADGTTEAGNVNLIHTQVKAGKTASGYGPTGSDLAAALVAGKQVPTNFAINGTSILNPWNAAYIVTSTGYGFTVTDTVPTDACAKMVQNASQTGDWNTIGVNGAAGQAGQIDLNTAGALCNGGDTNTIVFTSNT